jgi:hypothetical protein
VPKSGDSKEEEEKVEVARPFLLSRKVIISHVCITKARK